MEKLWSKGERRCRQNYELRWKFHVVRENERRGYTNAKSMITQSNQGVITYTEGAYLHASLLAPS